MCQKGQNPQSPGIRVWRDFAPPASGIDTSCRIMPSVDHGLLHEVCVTWPHMCQKWQSPLSPGIRDWRDFAPPANGINTSCRVMPSVGDGFQDCESYGRICVQSEQTPSRQESASGVILLLLLMESMSPTERCHRWAIGFSMSCESSGRRCVRSGKTHTPRNP